MVTVCKEKETMWHLACGIFVPKYQHYYLFCTSWDIICVNRWRILMKLGFNLTYVVLFYRVKNCLIQERKLSHHFSKNKKKCSERQKAYCLYGEKERRESWKWHFTGLPKSKKRCLPKHKNYLLTPPGPNQ